jgi:hypothetical protein
MAFGKVPFEETLGILNCRYYLPEQHPYSPGFISLIRTRSRKFPENYSDACELGWRRVFVDAMQSSA